MESIEEELAGTRMFRNLSPKQIKTIAGLGEEVQFGDGRSVMVEGDPADAFFLIREGFVAVEIRTPSGTITIETLHNGDPVGWSWLFEPYLLHFDCRSRGTTRAIRFDAAALREVCAEDAPLGYELMRSFTSVIVERLHATRIQLVDLYGSVTTT
jgi:CRP/FNR family transcriptional regulator, cyclic AMP receptor protein